MTDVSQRGDLLRRGHSRSDIARMTRSGELTRIRRGAYVEAGSMPPSPSAAHRMLLEATLPLVSTDAVVSHMTAALLHGLPVWNDQLTHLHLTISRPTGSKNRRNVRLDARRLEPEDVVLVDGIAVTSLARTVSIWPVGSTWSAPSGSVTQRCGSASTLRPWQSLSTQR